MAILFGIGEIVTDTSLLVDVGGRTLSVFALRTSSFVGSVEIQGRINADSAWHRVRYWVNDPDTLAPVGPFIDPIIPLGSGERHYYVYGPWRALRVSKTHGGGTIEVDHFASPLDPGYLFDTSAGTGTATEVTQSDAGSLQIAANLKVGLEDVGGLNPVPVSLVDIGELRAELRQIKSPDRLYEVEIEIPGITPANPLDANDAIGTIFRIPVPPIGIIESAKLIDPDDDTLALTAHLFRKQFVAAASDAAFTISAADSKDWITSITFDAPIVDIGSAKVSEKVGATYYETPDGYLWCQCSTTGTPNIAAGAMPILRLGIRVGEKA